MAGQQEACTMRSSSPLLLSKSHACSVNRIRTLRKDLCEHDIPRVCKRMSSTVRTAQDHTLPCKCSECPRMLKTRAANRQASFSTTRNHYCHHLLYMCILFVYIRYSDHSSRKSRTLFVRKITSTVSGRAFLMSCFAYASMPI
jgi:hypothetical protein